MNCCASFLSHKLLLLFVTATLALGIATTILGVDNTKLKNKIREMSCNTNSNDTNKYILPDSVKPISYDLYLYPDLTSGLYKGKIGISLKVLSTTNSISLNSHLLNIDKVQADSEDVNYSIEKQYQLLVIKKKDNSDFHKGKHSLDIEFNGSLLNRIVGFYSSSYRTSDGTSRKIATSKFEPTYARQAFPCFDEPNLKAKYKVHILKPKDASYIALSNFPVSNITKYDNDNELVSFEETVSMSTYLACFIVSDFTYSETSFDNMGKNIPLRVYASPGNLNKTQYAGEVGKKAIEFYIKYFQIPYPLPKLDMVAIPDFVSGAMEHWGLVTYRETALLYTDTTHSAANKQRVATVVAHELAHSWFGNLVTMNWWNDLWLNEGFASYIEYKGVLAAEPTWGMMDQFLVEDLHPVLILDSTLSSHAIVQTVITPDQITEIFDLISYNKGASILRMLENTVGEVNFQQGVKNYLNKYAYANAVTADFLNEIQNTVGDLLDVAEMMETFTVQMGYPVLNVTVSGNNYTFTQKRFLKDPSATYNEDESVYKYKWSVPVTYVTDLGKSTNSTIFQFTDDSITITKPENAKWIKFNYDQVGYYRVNYPVSEWEKLISYYGDLSIADRSHLLEETFSLSEAGLLNYTLPLELSKKLTGEFDYLPLRVAYAKLSGVLTYLRGSNSTQETAFKKYIAKIFIPAYNKFSWTEKATDSHLERLARVIALTATCSAEYKTCQDEAQIVFKKWLDTKEPLPPNLRALVYVNGIQKANTETWEKLLEIYKAENDAGEKLKLINGLANVENEELLKRLIELAKDESIVRRQDYIAVMGYIAANPYGTQCVWDWVRSNWEYLVDRFTLNDRTLGSLMPLIASQFATQEKFDEMNSFFAKYPEAGAGKANRAKALETVKNNLIWLSKYKTVVENWIVNNSES